MESIGREDKNKIEKIYEFYCALRDLQNTPKTHLLIYLSIHSLNQFRSSYTGQLGKIKDMKIRLDYINKKSAQERK